MKPIELILPLKITSKLSLNAIYSGLHWAIRKKQAEQVKNTLKTALEDMEVPKRLFKKPVIIEFWWNSALDLDNHGYLAKLAIDGLKGHLIRNDSKKYIAEIHHAYWIGSGTKIKISEFREKTNKIQTVRKGFLCKS